LDTIAKKISGTIFHFSSYSTFDKLKLEPVSARVKVNKSIPLAVRIVNPYIPDKGYKNSDDDLLAPLPPVKKVAVESPASRETIWSVNGIENGNSEVGNINNNISVSANYKAPATVPSANPVAVSVKLLNGAFQNETFQYKKLLLKI